MVEEENYQFIVADNFATGEGRTISIMITRAYPRTDDYDRTESSKEVDGKFRFVMPPLKEGITPKVIAAREFAEVFGGWTLRFAENISRLEFLNRFSRYLPDHVVSFLTDTEDDAGNFKYFSQFHVNYS